MLTEQATANTADREALESLIGPERAARLREAADSIKERLGAGGTLWHVNSTGAGGGVAEMLHTVIPLYRSLGVPARWAVIGGDDRFFSITKRLYGALYGSIGDGGPLGDAERTDYLANLTTVADAFRELLGPDDIVILHDFQTTGLIDLLGKDVAAMYWRCHVGVDEQTEASTLGWDFLTPLLDHADGLIFSVDWHVPPRLRERPVTILPPFVAPFIPKNRDLAPDVIATALARSGLSTGPAPTEPTTVDLGGRPVHLNHAATVVSVGPPEPGQPIAAQISRWDRLKDMHGVLAAFTTFVPEGYLALVGPDPASIPDDIEQGVWFQRCVTDWQALPPDLRARVALICLPMADLSENAVLVNAIQRAATTVTQKSLVEGFGLTVAEAMLKSRVVVASAVGGIRAQITHGDTGLLVTDPTDLATFGSLVTTALADTPENHTMGVRARRHILDNFLPDREVVTTAQMITT
ncbi:glycosyltransferase [Luedemannella helvata]